MGWGVVGLFPGLVFPRRVPGRTGDETLTDPGEGRGCGLDRGL